MIKVSDNITVYSRADLEDDPNTPDFVFEEGEGFEGPLVKIGGEEGPQWYLAIESAEELLRDLRVAIERAKGLQS